MHMLYNNGFIPNNFYKNWKKTEKVRKGEREKNIGLERSLIFIEVNLSYVEAGLFCY